MTASRRCPRLLATAAVCLAVAAGGSPPASAHADPDEQIADLGGRIAKDPKDATLYLRRGELHRHLREWGAALADYHRARKLDHGLAAVDLCIGALMLDSGRPRRSMRYLDRFLAGHPDNVEALVTRARARVKLGEPVAASRDFTSAIDSHRGADLPRPEHYLERAEALTAAGASHLDEAIQGLDEGLERLGQPVTLQILAIDLETRRGSLEAAEARRRHLDAQRDLPQEEPAGPTAPTPSGTDGSAETSPPGTVLSQFGSVMTYLANTADPQLGLAWAAEAFDDSAWLSGEYGVGYEAATGAQNLLLTVVPAGSFSVYTRTLFSIAEVSAVRNVSLGADYDDGYVAFINGLEVYRSPEMPAGAPAWNTRAALHESSNGAAPDYGSLVDVTAAALPALHGGENVLAVGVWNAGMPSSDLVLVPYLTINLPRAVRRGPYLQRGTPTSMVVRWRTDVPTDSLVRFGPAPGALASGAGDPAPATEHVVTLSGLQSATTYYYAVGTSAEILAGGDADHFFVTPPTPGTAVPTRIWALGDSGTADSRARAVRDAYEAFAGESPPDLWLMLGDNAYLSGTDAEYQAAVFGMYPKTLARSVLWPTLGNHDGISADSRTQSGPYYDIFTLPTAGEAGGIPSGTEAYYSFDHANIHFICLDSYETDRSATGAMITWLRQDLAATRQDWVIAFWHHPPYSKGSHDSDREVELVEMRHNVLPVLEEGGVDLVLTGHSHSYERSFLLDGHYGTSNTLLASMIKDGGDGRAEGDGPYEKPSIGPAPHEGAVYVVSGSSGQMGGGLLNHPVMYLSLNVLGSLILDVNGLELRATFLDTSGAQRDHFTVMKGPGSPPQAAAGADILSECTSPAGAPVRLDGTASADADSSAGTNDDIVLFEWFEDFSSPSPILLGTGATLDLMLSLGLHPITLRVTDRSGKTATDDVEARVEDTAPPDLAVVVTPELLWPPDHEMAGVEARVTAADLCGVPSVALVSIESDEPDDAVGAGDGHTVGDIQDAEIRAADFTFSLRSERAASGEGRTYTITYHATDGSGNEATASAAVTVPHDRARR